METDLRHPSSQPEGLPEADVEKRQQRLGVHFEQWFGESFRRDVMIR